MKLFDKIQSKLTGTISVNNSLPLTYTRFVIARPIQGLRIQNYDDFCINFSKKTEFSVLNYMDKGTIFENRVNVRPDDDDGYDYVKKRNDLLIVSIRREYNSQKFIVSRKDIIENAVIISDETEVVIDGKIFNICDKKAADYDLRADLIAAFAVCFRYDDIAVKAFKHGLIDLATKTLETIDSSKEESSARVIKECIDFVIKMQKTMAEMGAEKPVSTTLSEILNGIMTEYDTSEKLKQAKKDAIKNAQDAIIEQIKARSELLDAFNEKT